MKKLLLYIIDCVENSKCKYEVHSFESEAMMIDIWLDSNFYVVQIEEESVGLSLITTENPGFDTIPDRSFKNIDAFKAEFKKIFTQNF